MSFEDIEIYQGKKASDLFKDIVSEADERKNQIDLLISELKGLIKTPNDALMLVPLMRDYLEVSVKNTAEKNKLAAVIQKLISMKTPDGIGGNGLGLSDEEREELLKEVQGISSESDNLSKEVKEVEKRKKITLNLGEE